MRHRLFLAAPTFSTYASEPVSAVPHSIRKQRHVGRRQERLVVRRMREQARAYAAALPAMRAADAAGPTNGTVRRIARAFYV
jgi:hypothetical protein